MSRQTEDRQYRSEMGRLMAAFASGMAVKAAIGVGVVYAVIHGYHWIVGVFAPINAAMGG
jgi:hypothetical protein